MYYCLCPRENNAESIDLCTEKQHKRIVKNMRRDCIHTTWSGLQSAQRLNNTTMLKTAQRDNIRELRKTCAEIESTRHDLDNNLHKYRTTCKCQNTAQRNSIREMLKTCAEIESTRHDLDYNLHKDWTTRKSHKPAQRNNTREMLITCAENESTRHDLDNYLHKDWTTRK